MMRWSSLVLFSLVLGSVTLVDSSSRYWTDLVDDDVLLRDLYIPGTHDSAAHHAQNFIMTCQDWKISDQLRKGIRALDLRVRKTSGDWWLSHGKTDYELLVDEMKIIDSFIKTANNDFVLLFFKPEDDTVTEDEVVEKVREWCGSMVNNLNSRTVGWARSRRIICMSRHETGSLTGMLNSKSYDGWNDALKVKSKGIRDYIMSHSNSFRALFVSYPRDFRKSIAGWAKLFNPRVYCYLKYDVRKTINSNSRIGNGIYFFDFPTEGLIDRLVMLNCGWATDRNRNVIRHEKYCERKHHSFHYHADTYYTEFSCSDDYSIDGDGKGGLLDTRVAGLTVKKIDG